MKKTRLLIVVAVAMLWLFIPWTASAKVYFNEDFNAIGGGVPDGWLTKGQSQYPTYNWSGHMGASFDGSTCIGSISFMGLQNIILSPIVDLSGRAELKFRYNAVPGSNFDVGITTDDGVNVEWLMRGLVAEEWTEYIADLSAYMGVDNLRIVLSSVSPVDGASMYPCYVDDFVVESIPFCAHPVSLTLTSMQQTSVMLNWRLYNKGGVPDRYIIEVRRSDDNVLVYSDSSLVAVSNTAPITGLADNTSYYVTLMSDCSDNYQGYSQMSEIFRFTTLAKPVGLSYMQHFDDATVPVGWVGSLDNGNVLSVSSEHNYSGSGNSLKLSGNGDVIYAVTPQFDQAANDMQFSAFVLGKAGQKLSIGVMSDPADPSSFFSLLETELAKNNEWEDIRVNTREFPLTDKNYSFVVMLSGGGSVYIDAVDVRSIPSCPRPEQVSVLDVDSNSVKLSWKGNSNSITTKVEIVSGVDVIYRELKSEVDVVEGLQADTHYTLRLCEVCAVGDTTEWSIPVEFTTQCAAVPVTKFGDDFEQGYSHCWTKTGAWQLVGGQGRNGGNCMRFYDQAGNVGMMVTQRVRVDAAGKYDVSLWVNRHDRSSNAVDDEGVTVWINDEPDTIGARKCMFVSNYYAYEPFESRGGWYNYTTQIEESGTVYVIFTSVGGRGFYTDIDDVEIVLSPKCRGVKNVAFTDATDSQISVQWEPAAGQNVWLVDYKLMSANDTVIDTVEVRDAASYVFDGLTDATEYGLECSVAALCSGADTSVWSDMEIKFTTKCLPITDFPMTEDFEGEAFPPKCWITEITRVDPEGTARGGWVKETWVSDLIHTGIQSASCSQVKRGQRSVLVTPRLDLPTDDYEVQFYMSRSKYESFLGEGLQVWVNTTPDTVGGTKLGFLPTYMGFDPVESKYGMYLYSYRIGASGKQYIVFESTDDNNLSIDDVRIRRIPTCVEIEDFEVDSVGANTASIAVLDANLSWQAEYGSAGFEIGEGVQSSVFSTARGEITGLAPGIEYEIYVRSVCTTTDMSEWSRQPVVFRTDCEPTIVEGATVFIDDFEKLEVGSDISACYRSEYTDDCTARFYVSNEQTIEKPLDGEQFALYKSDNCAVGHSAWVFYPVQLKRGVVYESIGHFASNKNIGSVVSMAVSTSNSSNHIIRHIIQSIGVGRQWTELHGTFSVEEDGVYYIGLEIQQERMVFTAFDNLMLKELKCVYPQKPIVLNATPDKVTLAWTSPAKKFEVKVADHDFAADVTEGLILHDEALTQPSVVIENLTAATEYYYAVRSICDDGKSEWIEGSFRTPCEAVVAPITEDAEDVLMSGFECWTTGGVVGDFIAERSTEKSYSGAASLKLKNIMVVTPMIDTESLAGFMVNGFVYSLVDSAQFTIGVASDLNDMGSYCEIGTVDVPKAGTWMEFTQLLNSLADEDVDCASAKYVYIQTAGEGDCYFDDLYIAEVPVCRRPSAMVISEVGSTQFTLDWQPNGEEESWVIRCVNNVTGEAVERKPTTRPAVVGGLTANTDYSVYIKADCGGGEMSREGYCGSLTTQCERYAIPYDMADDNIANGAPQGCWRIGDLSNPDSDIAYDNWYFEYDRYYFRKSDYLNRNHSTLITPAFATEGFANVSVKFAVRNIYGRNLEVKLSTDGGSTFDITLCTVAADIDFAAQSRVYEFDLTEYIGKEVSLSFEAEANCFNDAFTYNYIMIELTKLEFNCVELCARPEHLYLKEVQPTQAYVSFVDTFAVHDAWQYALCAAGGDVDAATPVDIVSRTFAVENLQPKSEYDLYIRTKCVDIQSFSSWSEPLRITTNDVDAVNCNVVTDFVISAIGDNSVTATVTTLADTIECAYGFGGMAVEYCERMKSVDKTFIINGLSKSTSYVAYVRGLCSNGDTSAWSVPIYFSTACDEITVAEGDLWSENFDGVLTQLPDCWNVAVGSRLDREANWAVAGNSGNKSMRIDLSAAEGHAELRLPTFDVAVDGCRLMFDYMNTSDYDTLHLVVSTDGGVIFTDTLMSAVGVDVPTAVICDLSKYESRQIVMAFTVNASYSGIDLVAEIDNLQMRLFDKDEHFDGKICLGDLYVEHGFNIPAEELSVRGNYYFEEHRVSAESGRDRIVSLDLFVGAGGETMIDTVICEGDVYVNPVFPKGISKSGDYIGYLRSKDGCDSIVVLYLALSPSYVELDSTICEGDTVDFGGERYFETGEYTHVEKNSLNCDSTTVLKLTVKQRVWESDMVICAGQTFRWNNRVLCETGRYDTAFVNVNGCDSVEVLNLTVLPDTFRIDTTICYGAKFRLGDEFKSETGLYRADLLNHKKCDSIVLLSLTVAEPDTVDVEDVVCEGHRYTGFGYINIDVSHDTVLISKTTTADGCVAFERLTLDLQEAIEVTIDTTIGVEEYIDFGGVSLNKPGLYHDTVQSPVTGCDSITHLNLTVMSGVADVVTRGLQIVPNPLAMDAEAIIHHEWTEEERRGLTVEVLSSTGQRVILFEPDVYPLRVGPFTVAGVYTVRVMTGTGDIFVTKIIVK